MAVYTSGDWRVKPGLEREFVEAWRALADWTMTNYDVTVDATLLRDGEDPSHFVSFGGWPDEQTIRDWRSSEGFRHYITKLRDVTATMRLKTYEIAAEAKALSQAAR